MLSKVVPYIVKMLDDVNPAVSCFKQSFSWLIRSDTVVFYCQTARLSVDCCLHAVANEGDL